MRTSSPLMFLCGLFCVGSALAGPSTAADCGEADKVFAAAGGNVGLCIDLACGQVGSPGLPAGLATRSGMMVHGLALDDGSLARARSAIDAHGVAGRAMAERLIGSTLPYLPGLARLVVVEDQTALAAAGVTKDEMLRVLAPGGALCIRDGANWIATVKPRPKEMDEWTHPHHGPDENMVSAEKMISFPLEFRWIDGVPFDRGGFGECASCRAVVLAGGRCFTVNTDDISNLTPNRADAWLIARDAYSGLPLWKLNCEATYGKVQLDWRNVWPLVATDRRVYTARQNDLIMVAAATGKIDTVCKTKFPPRRLLLLDGCLVAGCWQKLELSNEKDGFENDAIRAVWWPGGDGTVEAFDAESGQPKWSLSLAALTLAANDGTLYILTHKGNPPTERQLVSVELATGREKWQLPHTAFGQEADICLNFAGPGCAVVSKTRAKGQHETFVLSAADGKVLFSVPNSTARAIVGGELWCNDGRYDLKTGAKRPGPGIGPTYAGVNIVGGCVPPIVVGDRLITGSRSGSYLQLPDAADKPPAKLSFQAVRGACLQGMVPANGMFYTAQNNCACYGAQVGGFIAAGPGGEPPSPDDFAKPRPIEKGPAFGVARPAAATGDWPTYRQNVERSAGLTTSMPDKLKVLWKTPCAAAGESLPFGLAESWTSRIGAPQPLTAPIVAGGMVIVGGFNSGQVIALKPDTGGIIWKASLASRLDSPPTCYKGLLLVGCHDGWVYGLRTQDGQLAYRVRIAPADRRIIDHGMVESLWPATGSVLVYDGLAYATAGRSTEASGGIALVAFRPETGETVWTKLLGAKLTMLGDVLAVRNGELAWHWLRMDPKTGAMLPPAQKFSDHVEMLDGSWSAGFSKRSGGGFMLGRVCQSMMAWNEQMVVWSGGAIARAKADVPPPSPNAPPKHPDPFQPADFLWRTNLEPHIEWARVTAMALAGNTVFFAGSIYNGWQGGKYDGSALWVKSTADGRTAQPAIKLDCPPCYDGLAIGEGRVYMTLQDGTLMCLGQ